MVFILYKLYVLLTYTYPTPKLSPHRRRCIYIFPQKNSLCMIYKRFKLWGHRKCPHKSPSPCNTYVIPMSLYTCVSSCHRNTHTHTFSDIHRSNTASSKYTDKYCTGIPTNVRDRTRHAKYLIKSLSVQLV